MAIPGTDAGTGTHAGAELATAVTALYAVTVLMHYPIHNIIHSYPYSTQ